MSRTFRRKHAESIVAKHDYHHVAGVYTVRDFIHIPDHGHSFLPVYREPNKQERFQRWAELHTDKGCTEFEGMKNWERRMEQKRDRAKHRNKIVSFLKGVSDDVVVEKRSINPSYCW